MIELPVHDRQDKVVETLKFDESCLGKFINRALLHEAVVRHEANRRVGTASTKDIRAIVGTSKKPHAQKHTGRARQGTRRRVGSRGGAAAHGPHPHDHDKAMPKSARRAALRSALLGKFRDGEVVVVTDLNQTQPKTKEVATTLKNLKLQKKCLVVTHEPDANLWKSARNIPTIRFSLLRDLNAYAVLNHRQVLLTKAALQAIPQETK
jgi:large subunit ribosomal protein L4